MNKQIAWRQQTPFKIIEWHFQQINSSLLLPPFLKISIVLIIIKNKYSKLIKLKLKRFHVAECFMEFILYFWHSRDSFN